MRTSGYIQPIKCRGGISALHTSHRGSILPRSKHKSTEGESLLSEA